MTPNLLRGALFAPQANPSYAITQNDIDVLVELSEAHGIAPVDVAVVLYTESAGFNPASLGPGGTGAYTGLNQMSVANLATYGIAPADWVTYTAAEQLPVIFKFWQGLANSFNNGTFPPNAAVLTALNFLPGNYKTSGAATNPNAAITSSPSSYYTNNTYYDPSGTGSITLNTIAQRVASTKASTASRWKQIESMIGNVGPSPNPQPGPSPQPSPSSSPVQSVWNDVATALVGGVLLGGTAFLVHREVMAYRPSKRRKRAA
jgi:hypothetical protein